MARGLVSDELETMWPEAVLTCLQSPGAAEENNKKPQYEWTTFGPRFNTRNLLNKAGMAFDGK
jgi:hypothetical protein